MTWRNLIPVSAYFDRLELTNQIRRIYDLRCCSPPKLILDRGDEDDIEQLCLNACEPAVIQLVRQADAVSYLPMFIRRYVTTLNALANEVDQLDLPHDLCQQLKDLLAMRRALLEAGWLGEAAIDDNQLLDEICHTHVSVSSFRTLPYEQLRNRYLDRCTSGQHKILRTLWIGEDGLRRSVEKYDLPLEILDWFNQHNIIEIRMLKKADVDRLVAIDLEQAQSRFEEATDHQTKHNQFKANLRNLFVNEVLAQSVEYEERMKHSLENINQAIDELTSIDRTAVDDKTSLRQRLTSVGARLQINWHFSKEELNNADGLLDMLIRDLRTFRESLVSVVGNRCPTDEELVTNVNENTALRGVRLIEPERKILRILLAPPVFVSFEEPSMSSAIKELTFLNVAVSEKFLQTIRTCGLNIAMKNFDDRSAVEIDQLVKMRCHIIPVRSFRMTKEQMKLSLEAKTALNLVTDLAAARIFLSDFGSHISEGTQHVGGIFIHQLSALTPQTTFREQWNATGAPGYRTHRCHLPLNNQTSHEPIISMDHNVQPIGPACENLELFENILKTHHIGWYLIDRGPASSLIPVWEIIDQLYPSDATMQESAQLLKRAWLTDASDCLLSESLLCEIDRVRLLQPTSAVHLQNTSARTARVTENVVELVNQLNEQIEAVEINVETMTDEECSKKVRVNHDQIFN